jgi:hypothetical protein
MATADHSESTKTILNQPIRRAMRDHASAPSPKPQRLGFLAFRVDSNGAFTWTWVPEMAQLTPAIDGQGSSNSR